MADGSEDGESKRRMTPAVVRASLTRFALQERSPRSPITPGRDPRRSGRRRLALANGQRIEGTPYRLERWIGEGGMGTVFSAVNVDLEKTVAVKIIHAEFCFDNGALAKFRNEAKLSARIGNPHIVDILDLRELGDGRLLIAMEFLDGRTLDRLMRDAPLGGPRFVTLFRQICQALAAAHEAGIVHRDVKPENVMVFDHAGAPDFVKVLDFGISHVLAEGDADEGIGTPMYVAPECIVGDVTPASDIYSLGCMMYECLCGRPPFEDDDMTRLLRAHMETPARDPRECSPEAGIAAPIAELVLACLAKSPHRRPTATELEARLVEAQIAEHWPSGREDLRLPEVDESRRAELQRGLDAIVAETIAPVRVRRRGLLVGTAAVAAVVGAWLWPRPEPPATDVVADLVGDARSAAARFWWVYPDRDHPSARTAYQTILEVEALETDDARAEAIALRREFADTLVRLGDKYFDDEAARRSSYEYYAKARLLDDANAGTSERALLSASDLAAFRRKAAEGTFSSGELTVAQPLLALAEPDEARRVQRLQDAIAQAPDSGLADDLDALVRRQRRKPRPSSAARASREATPADVVVDVPPVPSATTDDEATAGASTGAANEPVPEEPVAPDELPQERRNDRAAAIELVDQARTAQRAGRRREAITLLHQALDADNHHLPAMDMLGDLLFDDAEYADALKVRRRAARRSPRSGERWLALGDAYFKVSRYSDARDAFARAKELGHVKAEGRIRLVDRKLAE